MALPEPLLTIDDLCRYLSITKSTVYHWTYAFKIPHIKLPNGNLRFEKKVIDAWLKGLEVKEVVR